MDRAQDAPTKARMSGSFSWSAERTVPMICTSLWKDFGKGASADDQSSGSKGSLSLAVLSFEEPAGNLPCRVSLLLVINRKRKEIDSFPGLLAGNYGDQDNGISKPDQHGPSACLATFPTSKEKFLPSNSLSILWIMTPF